MQSNKTAKVKHRNTGTIDLLNRLRKQVFSRQINYFSPSPPSFLFKDQSQQLLLWELSVPELPEHRLQWDFRSFQGSSTRSGTHTFITATSEPWQQLLSLTGILSALCRSWALAQKVLNKFPGAGRVSASPQLSAKSSYLLHISWQVTFSFPVLQCC